MKLGPERVVVRALAIFTRGATATAATLEDLCVAAFGEGVNSWRYMKWRGGVEAAIGRMCPLKEPPNDEELRR